MAKKKKQKRNLKLRFCIFFLLSLVVCSTFFFNDTLEVWINSLINPPISEDVENCELKVHFIDERLTSAEAEEILISSGVRREKRKELIDKLSAQIILQTFIDNKI